MYCQPTIYVSVMSESSARPIRLILSLVNVASVLQKWSVSLKLREVISNNFK